MARNSHVELNLVVGKSKSVSPNLILPTFKTCIKNCRHLHSLKCFFGYHVLNRSPFTSLYDQTNISADHAYEGCVSSEARYDETTINLTMCMTLYKPKDRLCKTSLQ